MGGGRGPGVLVARHPDEPGERCPAQVRCAEVHRGESLVECPARGLDLEIAFAREVLRSRAQTLGRQHLTADLRHEVTELLTAPPDPGRAGPVGYLAYEWHAP